MNTQRILITTSWLNEGDDVHRLLLDAGHEVVYGRPADLKSQGLTLQDVIADVDGVIAGVEPFGADVLNAAQKLKVVARTGVGYDNVDLATANARGIAVCATPGVNRQSVAEFAIASLLNLVRQIPQNSVIVQGGGWAQPSGRELLGKTLGVVGLGAIGKTVAQLARAFGMRVIAYDPYFDEAFAAEIGVERVELPELIANADAITLHVFLNEETRHLINAETIATMRDGAIIVNAARGGTVDETALVEALRSGKLAGAALDTFEQEPLPADSPLRGVENLILTSHIAGATHEGRARSGAMAAESVVEVLNNNLPRQCVNKEAVAAAAV
ncbi:phosphoglycerate dehydrogenase [Arthrobacter ruber]|uniref:phosphoglycerate dehydrogenase n=1 Tax=Arthrobacter ruber TaxID=1258893 RepID=UPI000CF4CD3F|nr:phosphoglycerate dehydrogenase [Arthrobacter ruber]